MGRITRALFGDPDDYPDPPRPGWGSADDWDDGPASDQGNTGTDG